jgi:SAM-dependent methyltransferase
MKYEAYPNCPLCSGELTPHRTDPCHSHRAWIPGMDTHLQWMICSDCGHICTDKYALDRPDILSPDQIFPGSNPEAGRLLSASVINWVQSRHVHENGRWLEVGAGAGALALTAKEYGYKVTAIEPHALSACELMHFIDDTREMTFEEFMLAREPGDPEYEVVSLCDVIEHMPDPRRVLRELWGVVKIGGFLLITTPNRSAPAWTFLDQKHQNPYWGELEHCHAFTKYHLKSLLLDEGFRPMAYRVSERYRLGMEILAMKTDGRPCEPKVTA